MSRVGWMELLAKQNASGTLFTTYTTSKTVINPDALWSMPANYLDVGRRFLISVQGGISNIVTTPGTITCEVKIGSVVAFTTGAMQLSTTAHTTIPFWLDIYLTCQVIGSGTTAKFMGQGIMQSQTVNATAVADGTQTHTTLLAPNTAPALGTGFDSTVANTWDFWTGFSISNAGNGIQVQQYALYSLN